MTSSPLRPAPPHSTVPRQRRPDAAPRPDLAGPPWAPPSIASAGPAESYAHWWRRVLATLVDLLLGVPFWVAGLIGFVTARDATTITRDATTGSITDVSSSTATWVGGAIMVAAYVSLLVFSIWNQWVRQGRRGASVGKACLHLIVVDDRQGRPIGVLLTIVRSIAHLLDGIPLYLGYLWPLVDTRRQTFADKVMGTVVLHLPPRPKQPIAEQPLPYGW
jgi:uncharacterized RDD family membrane protein YckC